MSRSSRYLPWLALLAIGCAIGCATKQTGGSPETDAVKKGIVAILVGPKACDLKYPKVQISKADGEVAIWVAKKKTDKVRIEFEKEIFEGMTPSPEGGRWVPKDCGTRICYSGEIKETTIPSPTVDYKYWQVLIHADGTEELCDGHMIVNP